MSNGSQLFDRTTALAKYKRLLAAGLGASMGLDIASLDDDDLWDTLLAAEAWVAATLRVPLVPTRFFPQEPTQAQIDALNGQPWEVDTPYDYEPNHFAGDAWGFIPLRNKPVKAMHGVRLCYPSTFQTIMELPADWIRTDKKAATIQFVPTSTLSLAGVGGVMMGYLSNGRSLPMVVQVDYTAGLDESTGLYPLVKDVIYKRAMILHLEDSFVPQSGSISADGLSQSSSIDTAKYHEAVENAINGSDGNGGLMARIHGVRLTVC